MPLNREAQLLRDIEDLRRTVRELQAAITPSIAPVVQSVVVAQSTADSKSKVLRTATAPDPATSSPQDVWIPPDTNTPHALDADTGEWEPIPDKTATDAATDAAQASSDAAAANQNASDANAAAQTAQEQAQAAQQAAAAKTKTTWSSSVPDNTANPGTADGDTWYVTNGTGGAATAQYRWAASSASWTLTPINGTALQNVIADTVKAGAIDGQTITGATVRSAGSGQRVELLQTRLDVYNTANVRSSQLYGYSAGTVSGLAMIANPGQSDQSTMLVTNLVPYSCKIVPAGVPSTSDTLTYASNTLSAKVGVATSGLVSGTMVGGPEFWVTYGGGTTNRRVIGSMQVFEPDGTTSSYVPFGTFARLAWNYQDSSGRAVDKVVIGPTTPGISASTVAVTADDFRTADGASIVTRPAVVARRTSDTTFAATAGAVRNLSWDTTDVSRQFTWDGTTATVQIAGRYRITGSLGVNSGSTSSWIQVYLLINGGRYRKNGDLQGAAAKSLPFAFTYSAAVGDTFRIATRSNTVGTAATVMATDDNASLTWLDIDYIGPQ